MNRFKINVFNGDMGEYCSYSEEDLRQLLTKALGLTVVENAIWEKVLEDFCVGTSDKIRAYGLDENSLKFIDKEFIKEYAETYLGLYNVEDVLKHAHEKDLISALEDSGYCFNPPLNKYDDADIACEYFNRELENIAVTENIDSIDQNSLQEIADLFLAANWEQRQKILNTIKSL